MVPGGLQRAAVRERTLRTMIDLSTLLAAFRSAAVLAVAVAARVRRRSSFLRCGRLCVAIVSIIIIAYAYAIYILFHAVRGCDAGGRAIGSLWRVFLLCIRHE
jgi:hypothetical protein